MDFKQVTETPNAPIEASVLATLLKEVCTLSNMVHLCTKKIDDLSNATKHKDLANSTGWLNFSEACSYLGIKSKLLYKYVASKQVIAHKQNNKNLYFKKSDLDLFLNEKRKSTNEPNVTSAEMQSSNYFVSKKSKI